MFLDWSNIDTVLLDMDGTLLDLHFDNYFWLTHLPRRYAELFGLDQQGVSDKISRRLSERQGTLEWYSTDFWTRELGVDIVALKREVQHLIDERPKVIEFLRNLFLHGKRRILVTNADKNSIEIKLSQTSIGCHLDRIVSSHDFGAPKEQNEFWDMLNEHMFFDPSRTLFIDDSEPVLRSAKRYGIINLLGIARPDSQLAAKTSGEFVTIEDFDDLLLPA